MKPIEEQELAKLAVFPAANGKLPVVVTGGLDGSYGEIGRRMSQILPQCINLSSSAVRGKYDLLDLFYKDPHAELFYNARKKYAFLMPDSGVHLRPEVREFVERHYDGVVTFSNEDRENLIVLGGYDPKRVTTLGLPIVTTFDTIGRETLPEILFDTWPMGGYPNVFLSINAALSRKNFFTYLKALQIPGLDDERVRFHLHVGGLSYTNPHIRNQLIATAQQQRELFKVPLRITGGLVSPRQLQQWLVDCHTFVNTSAYEGFGFSPATAYAFGKTVVTAVQGAGGIKDYAIKDQTIAIDAKRCQLSFDGSPLMAASFSAVELHQALLQANRILRTKSYTHWGYIEAYNKRVHRRYCRLFGKRPPVDKATVHLSLYGHGAPHVIQMLPKALRAAPRHADTVVEYTNPRLYVREVNSALFDLLATGYVGPIAIVAGGLRSELSVQPCPTVALPEEHICHNAFTARGYLWENQRLVVNYLKGCKSALPSLLALYTHSEVLREIGGFNELLTPLAAGVEFGLRFRRTYRLPIPVSKNSLVTIAPAGLESPSVEEQQSLATQWGV